MIVDVMFSNMKIRSWILPPEQVMHKAVAIRYLPSTTADMVGNSVKVAGLIPPKKPPPKERRPCLVHDE